ncbi:hypothetical protein Tco_0317493, partial [Tanacetum coccineum]
EEMREKVFKARITNPNDVSFSIAQAPRLLYSRIIFKRLPIRRIDAYGYDASRVNALVLKVDQSFIYGVSADVDTAYSSKSGNVLNSSKSRDRNYLSRMILNVEPGVGTGCGDAGRGDGGLSVGCGLMGAEIMLVECGEGDGRGIMYSWCDVGFRRVCLGVVVEVSGVCVADVFIGGVVCMIIVVMLESGSVVTDVIDVNVLGGVGLMWVCLCDDVCLCGSRFGWWVRALVNVVDLEFDCRSISTVDVSRIYGCGWCNGGNLLVGEYVFVVCVSDLYVKIACVGDFGATWVVMVLLGMSNLCMNDMGALSLLVVVEVVCRVVGYLCGGLIEYCGYIRYNGLWYVDGVVCEYWVGCGLTYCQCVVVFGQMWGNAVWVDDLVFGGWGYVLIRCGFRCEIVAFIADNVFVLYGMNVYVFGLYFVDVAGYATVLIV